MIKRWLARFIFSGVKHIQKFESVKAKDGDVIFIEIGKHITPAQASNIVKNIKAMFEREHVRVQILIYGENDIKSLFKLETR